VDGDVVLRRSAVEVCGRGAGSVSLTDSNEPRLSHCTTPPRNARIDASKVHTTPTNGVPGAALTTHTSSRREVDLVRTLAIVARASANRIDRTCAERADRFLDDLLIGCHREVIELTPFRSGGGRIARHRSQVVAHVPAVRIYRKARVGPDLCLRRGRR